MKYLGNKNDFAGLEIIDTAASYVKLTSDEVTALCPITGQPDYYVISIELIGGKSIESKSLKLYFVSLRSLGMFCEDLSKKIKDDVKEAGADCKVTVIQKPRGGISIEAKA